ncbi:hypothetical protein HBB16_20610 [Pseudonocardia sp. MCCB 268]|nr:hypothetical protein [Pseudonocardia cytotoxica]
MQVIYPQPQVDIVQQLQQIPNVSPAAAARPSDLGALRSQPAQPGPAGLRYGRRCSFCGEPAGHHRYTAGQSSTPRSGR